MYDATLGRFLQRDPLGLAAGQAELYEYVGDGPANGSDWSGMASPTLRTPNVVSAEWIQDQLEQLGTGDIVTQFKAYIRLNRHRVQVIAYLARTLEPAVLPDPALVRCLIADLGSEEFDVRQRATERLVQLGPEAGVLVRQALNAWPPLEERTRLDRILAQYEAIDRQTIMLLEFLAPQPGEENPELLRLIERIAGGAPSLLTAVGQRLQFNILRRNGQARAAVIAQTFGLGFTSFGVLGGLPGLDEELSR
jgi:hypothetical protein